MSTHDAGRGKRRKFGTYGMTERRSLTERSGRTKVAISPSFVEQGARLAAAGSRRRDMGGGMERREKGDDRRRRGRESIYGPRVRSKSNDASAARKKWRTRRTTYTRDATNFFIPNDRTLDTDSRPAQTTKGDNSTAHNPQPQQPQQP